MRTPVLVLLLLAGCAAAAPPARTPSTIASGTDEAAALAVVERLFDAMRAADAAAFRAAFHPDATLQSVASRPTGATVQSADLETFATAVGTPRPVVWDERISNPVVRIDGDLASVWVDYRFYAGDRFSHCGVDSFQMVRAADGWKIFHLVDTRREQGC